MKKRNYGLDIFRILCCVGVLDYHIMGAALSGTGGYRLVWQNALLSCSILCSGIFSDVWIFSGRTGRIGNQIC